MRVAFIGMGNMGAPMAANLLRAGHQIAIPERGRSERVLALRDAGARLCPTAADCAQDCDAVILALPSSHEVAETIEGPDGIGPVLRRGAIVVDCTTSVPALTRRIAAQLDAMGVTMIDAPMVRGVNGARSGTLAFFVGGTDEAVDRAMPLLEAMGDTFIRVGAAGAGHTTKILNNLLSLGHLSLLAEALELAERNGVEFEPFVAALMSGNARSATLEQHATRTASKSRESVLFRIALAAKDTALASDLADALPVPRASARHVSELYSQAIAQGLGDEDITTISELFREP